MAEEPIVSTPEKTPSIFPETGFGNPPEIRKAVIDQTQTVLEKSLEAMGVNELQRQTVLGHWGTVKDHFENGGDGYAKQELLAHNIYHVAKMVTLAAAGAVHLQKEGVLSSVQAVSFLTGAIWHDHGNLRRGGEIGPMAARYSDHEERSVEDARAAGVDELALDVIRLTNQKYAGVFVQGGLDEVAELPVLRSVIEKNGAVEEDWMKFGSDFAKNNPDRLFRLARLLTAADNLSYATDPTTPLESIALWEENAQVLAGGRSLLEEKRFGPKSDFIQSGYARVVNGSFADQARLATEFLPESSGLNWWEEGARRSEHRRARFQEIQRLSKPDTIHWEGGLSYHQLAPIARQFGIYESVEATLLELQSVGRSQANDELEEAVRIRGLGTRLVREMLANLPKGEGTLEKPGRQDLITEVTRRILSESVNGDGITKLNLLVSPEAFAYHGGDFLNADLLPPEDFLTGIKKGVEGFWESQTDSETEVAVFYAIRQDRWEGQEAGRNPAAVVNQISELNNLDLIQGVSLVGLETEEYRQFNSLTGQLLERGMPVSVYLGQEEVRPENVQTIKDWAQAMRETSSGQLRLLAPLALVKDEAAWNDLLGDFSPENPLMIELPFRIGRDFSLPKDLPWGKLLQDKRVSVHLYSSSPMLEMGALPLAALILEEEVPGIKAEDLFRH